MRLKSVSIAAFVLIEPIIMTAKRIHTAAKKSTAVVLRPFQLMASPPFKYSAGTGAVNSRGQSVNKLLHRFTHLAFR